MPRRKKKKTSSATGPCAIDGCTRDAFYVRSGLCTACYSAMYYWVKGKGITAMIEHVQKLKFREGRLEGWMPANVVVRRKRRKVA